MYCKYCGKEISENSKFCKFCGKLVDDSEQLLLEVNHKDDKVQKEISVSATIENPLKVELSRRPSNKKYKSAVANEIMANLKMIGFALIICIVYYIGFTIFHLKDIAKAPEKSYFGSSCYDGFGLSGDYIFDWEEHYYNAVYYDQRTSVLKYTKEEESEMFGEWLSSNRSIEANTYYTAAAAYLLAANKLAKERKFTDKEISALKTYAKEEAKSDKEEFYDDVNRRRIYLFKEDLTKHATWSGVIVLLLMILGRYVVRSVKWVNNNKTE